jgi:hypothetical protein
MAFINQNLRVGYSQARFGLGVDRATATLPQTTQAALFTVAGGRIAVLGLVGDVTTATNWAPSTASRAPSPMRWSG